MAGEFDPVEWITTNEAAAMTGYSSITLRQFAREGRIKSWKRGRDWFLLKAAVMEYLSTMQQMGTDKHNPWRDDLEEQGRGRKKSDGAE